VPQSWCSLDAVSGVECRPGCRDMPLYAAICRSLERKLLIFLRVGFFFASQLRWRCTSRAKLARESEGRGLGRPTVGFQASEASRRIPPGAPSNEPALGLTRYLKESGVIGHC
jgi:hypothetical protein